MIDRDALIKEVAKAFVEYCRERPWLELSVDQVAAIMVDIVLARIGES